MILASLIDVSTVKPTVEIAEIFSAQGHPILTTIGRSITTRQKSLRQ